MKRQSLIRPPDEEWHELQQVDGDGFVDISTVDRTGLLHELNDLCATAVKNEAAVWGEVAALPELVVPRVSLEGMEQLGMQRRQCHLNVLKCMALLADGRIDIVVGWITEAHLPRLHSIIRHGGELKCVTPNDFPYFRFKPDPLLEHHLDATGTLFFTRSGIRAPKILRQDPPATIALARQVRAAIKDGADQIFLRDLQQLGLIARNDGVEG